MLARNGHERMQQIKDVIRSKLMDCSAHLPCIHIRRLMLSRRIPLNITITACRVDQ